MKNLILTLLSVFIACNLLAKEYEQKSPQGNISIKIEVNDVITYSVLLNGNVIISPSEISMTLDDGQIWGENAKIKKAKTTSISQELTPVINKKYSSISNEYNQLTLSFKGYSLEFRVYDEGAAYRWVSSKDGNYKIKSEQVNFAFPADHNIWFPEEESMFSHQERQYLKEKLSGIGSKRFCSTGMLVDCGNGVKTYISESGLMDYSGLWLQGNDKNPYILTGKFPSVVLEEEELSDRDIKPVKFADYIAECNGPRVFPWRVMLITKNDADLVQSELIYKLAPEQKIENTAWIKPGKVAWDWWNALNIYGVDFKSGVNNNTYKYYIDFASKYKLDYIILDEGWYHLGDVLDVVDEINVKELVDYGKEKNVGVILWVVWKSLDNKLIEALDQFKECLLCQFLHFLWHQAI